MGPSCWQNGVMHGSGCLPQTLGLATHPPTFPPSHPLTHPPTHPRMPLQIISLICTNRPGAAPLNYFTASSADQPGSSGAAGTAAEGQQAAAAADGSEEGSEEQRPKKRRRKGKEKVGEPAAGTTAAAAAAGGTTGGGKGGNALQQEAAQRAAAQELPPSLPAAGGPRGTLIVCPLSVVSNWQMQIEEHTGGNLSGGWAAVHMLRRASPGAQPCVFSKPNSLNTVSTPG